MEKVMSIHLYGNQTLNIKSLSKSMHSATHQRLNISLSFHRNSWTIFLFNLILKHKNVGPHTGVLKYSWKSLWKLASYGFIFQSDFQL